MLLRVASLVAVDRKPLWLDPLADNLRRYREIYLTVCLVLAVLVPVLAVKLPPMADLLGHMGRYSIQKGLEQHPWLKQYFSFEWQIIGNLGADLLMQTLHPFFGVEASVRLIVVVNQLLAATAVVMLCREAHGRITPFCIFALPLIYSVPFNWGFLNFTLSMALALLAFVLWLRLTRLGLVRLRQYIFVPIALVLWICHAFGWAFLGLLCVASCLVRSHEARRKWPLVLWDIGLNCLPLLAPVVPMLLWQGGIAGKGSTGWFQFGGKLLWMLWMLRLDWEIFDKLSALALFLLTYLALRDKKIASNRVLAVAAGFCFTAFLLMPLGIFGSYYADMRLLPYTTMLALLAFDDSKLDGGVRRWLMAAAIVFLVVRLVVTTHVYVERERILNAHLEALDALPERARVASLVSLPCPTDWELPWLSHIGSMAIVRNRAFANDQWAEPGMNPLKISFPEAGFFAKDPSSFTYPERCELRGAPISATIARLPKTAFTHIWITGIPRWQIPHPTGTTLVWQNDNSVLFRIDPLAGKPR
jgi:hypothetical protein